MIEIGNAAVGRKRRIDGEVHAADHPLVRPGIVPPTHVDADDFRDSAASASTSSTTTQIADDARVVS